ncbi:MAG: hypothetical protein mread185_000124 [Mycoplasmataceae bacterium]|nr:MAG: hypothetical protein mread185_000124 [Mycoplasmataceae bacterium]
MIKQPKKEKCVTCGKLVSKFFRNLTTKEITCIKDTNRYE